jgi:sodium-dependent dicarboxylate transporter 2/3/5
MKSENSSSESLYKKIGLILGPTVAFVILAFFELDSSNPLVTRTAAVALLMAIWWITEAIPIPVTAMLPLVLFPLLGVMNGKEVAGTYVNHIIFLFIGGFIMALGMQKWKLHRRIALKIILLIGSSPKRVLLGFMISTAFLSMWISNTATTMMMVPIGIAIVLKFREMDSSSAMKKFGTGLMIGIAYAASIGGLATLIGTPPNLSFTRIYSIYYPQAPEISFADWFIFGLPLSIIFLFIVWLVLLKFFKVDRNKKSKEIFLFKEEYNKLGRMSYEERIVLILFGLMALMWLFRKSIVIGGFTIPGWSELFSTPAYIDDGTVAIAIAMLLFIIPSRSLKTKRLMDWETAVKLKWGIVILFGGGFALASGFKESGLSIWLAEQLTALSGIPELMLVGSSCTLMTFLTELTSNTATTEMILPLLGSLADAIKVNPLLLMIPATLSASCAFMLPVATPPNAIVFGSGEVKMSDMIKVGIIINLIGILLITAYVFTVGRLIFNIN